MNLFQLPKGFNGCLKDLRINGEVQDIHSVGRPLHVTRGCHEQVDAGFYLVSWKMETILMSNVTPAGDSTIKL